MKAVLAFVLLLAAYGWLLGAISGTLFLVIARPPWAAGEHAIRFAAELAGIALLGVGALWTGSRLWVRWRRGFAWNAVVAGLVAIPEAFNMSSPIAPFLVAACTLGLFIGIAVLYTTRSQGNKQPALNDEDLELIATADAGTYPDNVVLAAWEELAARGVVVEFIEQQEVPSETPDLVTVATFRNYVQAQFTQSRLLSSGMLAFLFDDNTIRINWLWSTALGGVKLRVPVGDTVEALEILRLDIAHRGGRS